MKNPKRRTNNLKEGQNQPSYQMFRQGGQESLKCKMILLSLGVLNLVLLISAVVIGIKCAKVKQVVSNPASAHLISELKHLRRNYSDVLLAEEEVQRAIQTIEEKHVQLKVQLEHLKSSNEDYQKQLDSLRTERAELQSNVSSMEGSCGKCPGLWHLFNSSCYYFSIVESSTVQKNWYSSRADCIHRGSDLVVIDSPAEQTYLSKQARVVLGTRTSWENGFWVGLTDLLEENKWVWINNVTEVEPRYWVKGEPNNHGAEGEDCAVIVYTSSYPWRTRYDAKCQEHNLFWLCEMPAK